jgi:hypothetical protein
MVIEDIIANTSIGVIALYIIYKLVMRLIDKLDVIARRLNDLHDEIDKLRFVIEQLLVEYRRYISYERK